ncbi:Serine-arginine protein 55, partial [Trichinella pseudospiralis]
LCPSFWQRWLCVTLVLCDMGTRVYVGRIPYRATERDIEKFFRGFGRIREIFLKNGYGFVEFEHTEDADDACYELNGREMFGERLIVEIARGTPHGRDRYGWRQSYRVRSDRYDRSDIRPKSYHLSNMVPCIEQTSLPIHQLQLMKQPQSFIQRSRSRSRSRSRRRSRSRSKYLAFSRDRRRHRRESVSLSRSRSRSRSRSAPPRRKSESPGEDSNYKSPERERNGNGDNSSMHSGSAERGEGYSESVSSPRSNVGVEDNGEFEDEREYRNEE